MTYPISEITGIGPEVADRLKVVGIRTTARLLDAAKGPKQRKRLAEQTGLDEKRILSWANTADRMRIKGVGADYAGLLQAAGVDTVVRGRDGASDHAPAWVVLTPETRKARRKTRL